MEIPGPGNTENSGKTKYQLLLIDGLKKEIELARKLDLEKLAAEIREMGFCCQHCGKCCRRIFGDNRVLLIPDEIKKILEYTGLAKLEIAGPFLPEIPLHEEFKEGEEPKSEDFFDMPEETDGRFSKASEFIKLLCEDIDSEGNIHAFAWALRRKTNGDCIFLEKNICKCRIYPVRPMLCKTYPFYLENLKLQTCECEGLGYFISPEDSRRIAENLFLRYISELEDTLGMYEKFINFERGEKGLELAKQSLANGACTFIVHDSTGSIKFID